MTIFWNEVKRRKLSLLFLTLGLTAMLVLCVVLYPLMKEQMSAFEDMAEQMGSLGPAMGMDNTLFSSYLGYYGAECEGILAMGGLIYAAYLGGTAVSKELKRKTGEFLFSHPVSRGKVLREKLLSSSFMLLIMNMVIFAAGFCVSLALGESFSVELFMLVHLALFIMQIEVLCITFCFSVMFKNAGAGVGIAIGFGLYFLDTISSLVEQAEFLKYITPLGYTHSSAIIENGEIDILLVALGIVYSAAALLASGFFFKKKDLVA